MNRLMASVLVGVGLFPLQTQDRAELRRRIEDLGSDRPVVREQAEAALLKIGVPAMGELQEALKGGDAEIVGRARSLLRAIHENAFRVTVESEKPLYAVGEPISVKVHLINESAEPAILFLPESEKAPNGLGDVFQLSSRALLLSKEGKVVSVLEDRFPRLKGPAEEVSVEKGHFLVLQPGERKIIIYEHLEQRGISILDSSVPGGWKFEKTTLDPGKYRLLKTYGFLGRPAGPERGTVRVAEDARELLEGALRVDRQSVLEFEVVGPSAAGAASPKVRAGPLEFTLSTDKNFYQPGEEIVLSAKVVNVGDRQVHMFLSSGDLKGCAVDGCAHLAVSCAEREILFTKAQAEVAGQVVAPGAVTIEPGDFLTLQPKEERELFHETLSAIPGWSPNEKGRYVWGSVPLAAGTYRASFGYRFQGRSKSLIELRFEEGTRDKFEQAVAVKVQAQVDFDIRPAK